LIQEQDENDSGFEPEKKKSQQAKIQQVESLMVQAGGEKSRAEANRSWTVGRNPLVKNGWTFIVS
jgi:hypothetical protein